MVKNLLMPGKHVGLGKVWVCLLFKYIYIYIYIYKFF